MKHLHVWKCQEIMKVDCHLEDTFMAFLFISEVYRAFKILPVLPIFLKTC